MNAQWLLARRYLFKGRARHISFIGVIACLGVTVGVAALIIVISVMNGFDRDLTTRLLTFNDHLTVETNDAAGIPKLIASIARFPEVTSAAVFIQTQIFAKFDEQYVPLVVKGIDFDNPAERKRFASFVLLDTHKKGFYLGDGIRRRFLPQDMLEYYPLDKKFSMKETPISGFFKVGLYDVDANFVITDVASARALSPNYFEHIGIRLRDIKKVPIVAQRIRSQYPQDVYVRTWMDSNQVLFNALELEKIAMFIILSLIVLVASFNIFATLTVKVVEKTKDIGILKAIGFTNTQVLTLFSLQGLLLGLIGVCSGTALGVTVCLALKKYPLIRLPESIYTIDRLPVALRIYDIALIMAVGLVLCLISSLAPAVRASKLSPSDALRYE